MNTSHMRVWDSPLLETSIACILKASFKEYVHTYIHMYPSRSMCTYVSFKECACTHIYSYAQSEAAQAIWAIQLQLQAAAYSWGRCRLLHLQRPSFLSLRPGGKMLLSIIRRWCSLILRLMCARQQSGRSSCKPAASSKVIETLRETIIL